MAAYDFSAPRLFVEAPLAEGADVALDRPKAHYLLDVLRLRESEAVLVFNGRDGEWRAELAASGRRSGTLRVVAQMRPQSAAPRLDYLFAPLKHARLDYLVQKAVEMGAGRLAPVLTRRTVPTRLNADRMRANVIEAAEQCGILALPEISQPCGLEAALASLDDGRLLVFCDEEADVADPLDALGSADVDGAGIAVLIGPEGGFDREERALILGRARVCRLSLGPRILRADTAAVAALALVQARLGDWR